MKRRDLIGGAAALAAFSALPRDVEAASRKLKVILRKPWTPRDLGGALVAWWSADDHGSANMTDDGSGLISNWIDRIGLMAITAATTARPTWTGGAFNGSYAGLTFDGTANCFVSTTLTTLPTSAVAGEIYAACSNTAVGSSQRMACCYGNSTASQNRALSSVDNGSTDKLRVSEGTTNINHQTAITGASILSGNWSGTLENAYQNGVAATGNPATIASLSTTATRFRIGAFIGAGATLFWQGAIRHVIVITGILSDADRQKLEGWLAWDGGMQSTLPGSHPYSARRP